MHPSTGPWTVLERLLREVVQQRGILSVLVFESDGFIVYSNQREVSQPADASVTGWKALLDQTESSDTVTLVQEDGYLILTPLPVGTLAVQAARTANLGALRQSIKAVNEQLNGAAP